MSNTNENNEVIETFAEATPVEATESTVPVEKTTVYIGKLRDCGKLNVRAEPSVDAKVLCRIDKNSEVIVDKSESTKDFYKICTSSGVEGYCMKQYMYVKKQEV